MNNDSGSCPLNNPRWEAFCQAFAGKAFGFAGRAYRMAGYRPKDDAYADTNGWALRRKTEVSERIAFLREERRKQLAIDAAGILERRLAVADDPETKPADRIAALKDIERSLGLQLPEKVQAEHSGVQELVVRIVGNEKA
jgi:hypothetical protein